MAICSGGFNGNPNFRNDIIDLLNKYIFYKCNKQLLDRYIQMERNCPPCCPPFEFEKEYTNGTAANQLQLNAIYSSLWSCPNLGHDLPVWINAGDSDLLGNNTDCIIEKAKPLKNVKKITGSIRFLNNKTIMLVGIDPMRKNQHSGMISLSTPWGVHCPCYRSLGTSRLIWQLICYLATNSNVYITDRNKLFAKYKNFVKTLKVTPSVTKIMIDCLQEEICLVKPDAVIFIGDRTSAMFFKKAICSTSKCLSGITYYHIPHPNARIKGGWGTSRATTI